jgi:GTP pyrophosphokinase
VLRKGATVLDFAFDVHTQIGAKCTAGKVNNHLVPISYVLQNGDQIEILTTKNQKPSNDWLRFVVTSKAKARIKDLLKEENKTYISNGKDLIIKKFKVLGLENTLETMNQLRAYFNKKDYNDLYYSVGKGHIQPDDIKKFKHERDVKLNKQAKVELDESAFRDAKTFEKEFKKVSGNDTLLIGDDFQKIDYTLSRCCNPIQGDDVFGFLTINEGIKIHRTSCPNSTELLSRHGDRVIKAFWTSQISMSFLAQLVIRGMDRMGLMNDVTRVISQELKVNIQSLSIGVSEGIFEGKISLMVSDTSHLETLVNSLEQVEGVIEVERGV